MKRYVEFIWDHECAGLVCDAKAYRVLKQEAKKGTIEITSSRLLFTDRRVFSPRTSLRTIQA